MVIIMMLTVMIVTKSDDNENYLDVKYENV